MNNRKSGITLVELAACVVAIVLLILVLVPAEARQHPDLVRAREMSKRLVCGANMKGIGTSCKIYANENEEMWPVPPFNKRKIGHIKWQSAQTGQPSNEGTPAAPGRKSISSSETTTLSTTRAFWMLIRTVDFSPKFFICPSSGDTVDPTEDILPYYDFESLKNISYGYQVPYGPANSRPSESLNSRMILMADKGPYSTGHINQKKLKAYSNKNLSKDAPLEAWRVLNSPNHGGFGKSEGQNTLYADGHSSFEKTPCVGVDEDNIYTRMDFLKNKKEDIFNALRIGLAPEDNTYPGMNALGKGLDASTDSLIYP